MLRCIALSFVVSRAWRGPRLAGPAGEELMELIEGSDPDDLFCELTRRFTCDGLVCKEAARLCSGSCGDCLKQRSEETLRKKLEEAKRLPSVPSSEKPMAIFVLGPVASGKSSFLRLRRPPSALHVNADALRADLLGGDAIYRAITMNGSPGELLMNATGHVRVEIQKWVLVHRKHYVTDSITLPLAVFQEFQAAGYDCQGFWMDLPGLSLSEKASEASRRVESRVAMGGHWARTSSEQIQRSRSSAEQLRQLGLEMNAFLSFKNDFKEEVWSCWKTFQPMKSDLENEEEALELLKRLVGPGEGFTVKSFRSGRVQSVAVKRPINATLKELNCAVTSFSQLEDLILDESNITGSLSDLELPSSVIRLQLRYCRVPLRLSETARWNLSSLKLEGKQITGDLSELNWRSLQFLDLRGAKVTGNLNEIEYSGKLKGFWAQYTDMSGDVTLLLEKNPSLLYLDLRWSKVTGSVNDMWKEVGQKLTELRLVGSKVTFDMSTPEEGKELHKVKKPFPSLTILDLSHCNLRMDVWELLLPLMYNDKIVWLAAVDSGLSGELKGMRRYKNMPTYYNLKILNLAMNNIQKLTGEPVAGCDYNLQGNPLESIDSRYFQWPASLDIRNSSFNIETDFDELLMPDTETWEGNLNQGWICDGVQARAERTSCRLRVSPASFAPAKLCSCFSKQGWAGQGANCTRCEGHMEVEVYESTPFGQHLSVCACPENTVPLFDRTGQQLGNSCYRCRGNGCPRCSENCTEESFNRCASGYEGTLCSHCQRNYFHSARKNGCVKCNGDGMSILMTYLAVPLLLLLAGLAMLRFAVTKSSESAFERGERRAELVGQGLLLITFVQIAKTVCSVGGSTGDAPLWAHPWDVLRLECNLGQSGFFVKRLSFSFLLPVLCSMCLLAGAFRGSPFYALKFCIIFTGIFFPRTIEATIANMRCVETDANSLSLKSTDGDFSFLSEFPFVTCDFQEYGWLWFTLRLAFFINVILLPGFLFSLGWYINRKVGPLWSSCRWLQPECQFQTEGRLSLELIAADFTCDSEELRSAALRYCACAHLACLAEISAPEPLSVEIKASPTELHVTWASDWWQAMRPDERERALRDVHSYAMEIGEISMYRCVSQSALKQLKAGALWIGAQNTFEKFAVADPLLFEGITKLVVFAITSLCAKREMFLVATCFFLLCIAVARGTLFGTRSRNELALSCYVCLGLMSLALFIWEKAPKLQLILLIFPILHFLHLQMMPGDTFLQANQLLKALPHSDVSFEVAPLAWRFESQRLAEAFNAYRRRQRRLRTQLRNLRLELEDKALELLSKSVRQAPQPEVELTSC